MVVVCGEALIDMIENRDGSRTPTPGGGPFNTSRALARLGVPTAFLGRLSEDAYGRQLAGLLVSDGASLAVAGFSPQPTTVAVARVDSHGSAEYQFFVQGTSAPNLTPDMVPAEFGPDVKALHVGTLGLALEPMASTLAELVGRERGRLVVMLDPNVRRGLAPDSEYRDRLHAVIGQSRIVKASEADLAWLYPGLDYKSAADRILGEGVSLVVVTLGAAGAFGGHRSFRIQVDAPQVQVVDTIGAGDAFGAALLAWLHDHDALAPELRLDKATIEAALEFACTAAAITCTRAGADPPWKWEMPGSNFTRQ